MISLNNFYNTDTKKRFYNPTYVFQVEPGGAEDFFLELIDLSNPIIVIYDPNIIVDTFVQGALFKFPIDREPTEDLVEDALLKMPNGNVNVIAIGGGSVIDFAKALIAQKIYGDWKRIGYGETRFLTDQNLYKPCRFIAIPTTPATGSEVSRYYLIKDSATNEKLVGRSWQLCPDIAILDPLFLQTLPTQILVSSIFDAFSHSWETLFCKYESSSTTKLFASESIKRIIDNLILMMNEHEPDLDMLSSLQYAAMLGGLCLSNTRTGFLHTSGEALSAQVNLPHPYTLRIFFGACLKSYEQEIEEPFEDLKSFLPKNIKSVKDIILFWDSVWLYFGLDKKIKERLEGKKIDTNLIMTLIMRDTVMISKEHPSRLTEQDIKELIESSLQSYGVLIC